MESAFTGKPGMLYLETIEESEIIMIRLKDFREAVIVNGNKCTGCRKCVKVCEYGAIYSLKNQEGIYE